MITLCLPISDRFFNPFFSMFVNISASGLFLRVKPHFSWQELDATSEDLRQRKMKNLGKDGESRERKMKNPGREKMWGEIGRRKLRIMCASRITTVVRRNELGSLVKNINKMCDPSSLLSALFGVTITKHQFLLLLSPMITKRWTRNHNKETGGRSRERRKKEERGRRN